MEQQQHHLGVHLVCLLWIIPAGVLAAELTSASEAALPDAS